VINNHLSVHNFQVSNRKIQRNLEII
jgi:hypothetical protein